PTPNTPGKTPEGGQKPSPQPDPTKTTAPPETAGIPAAIGSQPPAGNHPGSEPCYPIPSSQKFTLPLQTHVHPNWIFTQPGNYQVGIRQNARINGTWQSADTILNFTVGGAGNANEGHFDLGAKVENGRLVAALKDDRTPGGTWVDPRSLAFGLGTGSQAKLPAGLEFLAPAGTPVWMIGSTQTSGVPWLGANTQHPSLLQATNEPVSWEMISFRGPNPQARLAVFTSGNFGKIVGQKWFTAPTSAANVGRTASGKYCRLGVGSQAQNANISRVTGGLAATGIGNLTLALAVLAGGIILLGLGMFFQAADRKNAVAD
ncbi:choice-of-anchor M domain-containing protein, partial [Mobiluncus mulieris]|uniref:choice-of-anchor M domain-containing protein n=1 Tax=Mobiluncus mulieris TaxID=2052 RepID=UPI002431D8D7